VVWAARLPGTRVLSFHLSEEDVEQLDTPELLRGTWGFRRTHSRASCCWPSRSALVPRRGC
jgi:hypothetical protein